MGRVDEDAFHSRLGTQPTARVHIEPQRGKIVVDCVINPNRNKRRMMCSPSTCFSDIAADLEATLAIPATIISMSDIDGSVTHSGPLPFAEPLSAFGLKADDRITLEVHLLRKSTRCVKDFPSVEVQDTGGAAGEENKIRKQQEKSSFLSGGSSGDGQEKFETRKGVIDAYNHHLGAGELHTLNRAFDSCTETTRYFKGDQKCSTDDLSEAAVETSSSIPFLKAVSRWQAFSADSLDAVQVEPDRSSQVTHSTQTKEEMASRRSTRFHTETQTYAWGNSGVQLKREAAVQMQKRGLFIPDTSDRVLAPSGAYEDSDTLEKKKFQKSIIIQASVRRFLAQKKARGLRRIKEKQEVSIAARVANGKKERELFEWKEETRCLRPETYEDFRTLYAGLETWRQHEAKRIKQLFTKKEHRQQAFKELLQKETEVLQHIDELKTKAKRDNKQTKILHILDLLAQPLEWLSASTGQITTVHTPETMRAGELRDLYLELSRDDLPARKRLHSLLHIRQRVADAVSGREAPALINEFSELIGREIDLLQRGRTNSEKLTGLRQRLTHAFWYLIQTPQFNPQATRFLKSSGINLLMT